MTSNNDIFFQEIRKNAIVVQREIRSSEGTIINSLTESASALLWLSKVARHEGLLDLEMAAESERVAGLILGAELKRMLIFVSYAIDPEETAAILFKRYFSRNYEGVEGFFYLVYLDIVLKIQAGESHPYIILENIRSFMPDEVHAELDRIQEEEKKSRIKTSKGGWREQREAVEKLPLKQLFFGMSNRDIQRILKDIPRDTLSVAMKTWDRELRRLVCGNLPRHVEGIVTRNMERIDCGEKETEDANAFILDLIRRLADDAEIFTRG